MDRFVVSLSLVAAVGLGALAPASAQAAPPPLVSSAAAVPAATATGSVSVRLLRSAGTALGLPGATVRLVGAWPFERDATTDSTGALTFADVPVGSRYWVSVTPPPTAGHGRRTPVMTTDLTVRADAPTAVDVTLPVGGTLEGRLVGPWPTPPAGLTVEVYGNRTGTSLTSVTDAEGRYFFSGMPTDLYTATVVAAPGAVPTVWRQDVEAETATTSASHVAAAPRYVHTTYDLQVVVDEPDPVNAPGPDLDGAVVTITDTATGAVMTQALDATSSPRKVAQFIVPSGRYTVGVETASHQRWWWAGQYVPVPLVRSAAEAVPVSVTYGADQSTDVFLAPQSSTP